MKLVIVGADAAGMSAAHQAIRTARSAGVALDVVALEATHDTSYSACGIPYWIAGDVAAADDLVARTADQHRKAGIDLRLGATATELNLADQSVGYRHGGSERTVDYDQLVIGTGARAVLPDWAQRDGALLTGVAAVKTLADGATWLDLLDRPGRRVVICGGGYIGLEMAEAALRRDCEVTLITRSRVMGSLDPELSDRVEQGLRDAGVTVVTGEPVEGLTAADGRVTGVRSGGGQHDCDRVVLALGVTPNTGFAAAAGLVSGPSGGLRPDAEGRVADGVWAAGDCCDTRHRITGEWAYLPLGTHANKLGRVVGSNVIEPGSLRFGGVLGTAITRFVAGDVHLEIARTGLSSREVDEAGMAVTGLVTEGSTSSGYMPEAEPIAIKVLATPDRRLIGAQIVGGRGSAKRIDTFATAIWHGATVDDLAWADLSYAPPFSTAWEITQVAARRLAERLPSEMR